MSEMEAEAQRLDGTIDELLRGDDPTGALDPSLVATARLLHDALPRFHPRFGFEEALAVRLSRSGRSTDAMSEPIPFPAAALDLGHDLRRVWERYRRELVAGGAIASGVSIALPLAGAALVRWRRSRSSHNPGGLF